MNTKNVKSNIEVEVGYTTYIFDDIYFADRFCSLAAVAIDKKYNHHISMKVDYTLKEEGESDE